MSFDRVVMVRELLTRTAVRITATYTRVSFRAYIDYLVRHWAGSEESQARVEHSTCKGAVSTPQAAVASATHSRNHCIQQKTVRAKQLPHLRHMKVTMSQRMANLGSELMGATDAAGSGKKDENKAGRIPRVLRRRRTVGRRTAHICSRSM